MHLLWQYLVLLASAACGLKVQESETRDVRILDGIWNFRSAPRTDPDEGFRQEWFSRPLSELPDTIQMPVPSSFNDITQDKALRDHVGWVWYDREFFVPFSWTNHSRIVLRFESVHYFARVYLNGKFVMEHEGGHLSFEAEVNRWLSFTSTNRLTVAVNNTLTSFTLPCGNIVFPNDTARYPEGYFRQELIFDFFNYAGIHRSVKLYTTPNNHVSGVRIVTSLHHDLAAVEYQISTSNSLGTDDTKETSLLLEVFDRAGAVIATAQNYSGKIVLHNPRLWWPFTMNEDPGYLYTLKVTLSSKMEIVDIFRQKFGIRTVTVLRTGLLLNGKPFYFRGFGKHEDFHIFGRGFNLPLMMKDFNLIKWTGGNSFRTSHYPYAEEVLDYADEHGIVVIDESQFDSQFPNRTLDHHLKVMEELVDRDFNHPCVVMWSVANEPKSYDPAAEYYFRTVISHVKRLDPSRPVTFVIGGSDALHDVAAQFVDVLCVNHYFGWYSDPGHTELIQRQLTNDTMAWYRTFDRPVIITEYGADTMAGIHTSPSFIFSEEYQVEFMHEYHKTFDALRSEGVLTGEMVWNFADFMTDQQVNRVWGNRKGIFTRERQPKMSAHMLRARYWHLANATNCSDDTIVSDLSKPHSTNFVIDDQYKVYQL